MASSPHLSPSARVDIQYPSIMDGLVALIPPTGDQEQGVGLAGDEAGSVAIPPHWGESSRVITITQLGPVLCLCGGKANNDLVYHNCLT